MNKEIKEIKEEIKSIKEDLKILEYVENSLKEYLKMTEMADKNIRFWKTFWLGLLCGIAVMAIVLGGILM